MQTKYKIHEVAELFPMIPKGSSLYNDLWENIREFGQLDPIVVDGDTLLDGRNRLAICEDIGISPKVIEWSTLGISKTQDEWIYAKNWGRRNLTEDQRGEIYLKYNEWTARQSSKEKKEASKFTSENNPMKTTVRTKSYEPLKRDFKSENSNSTIGKLAEGAGISHHKAAKLLKLHKMADAGNQEARSSLADVASGIKKLKEIKIEAQKKELNLEDRILKAWKMFWKQFADEEKLEVRKWINNNL